MRRMLPYGVSALLLGGLVVSAQVQPQVLPLPIPGGDVIAPFGLFNQFLPGVGTGFDGPGSERDGAFVRNAQNAQEVASAPLLPLAPPGPGSLGGGRGTGDSAQPAVFPALKGKVPLKYLVH